MNSQSDQLQADLEAQLVKQRTGIAEVMGSNTVQALIIFRFSFHNCITIMIKCLHKDGRLRQNKVECRCNEKFFPFFFY